MTINVLDLYTRIGMRYDEATAIRLQRRAIKRGPGAPNWHRDVMRVKYSGAVLRVIRKVNGIGRPLSEDPGHERAIVVRDIITTKLEAMT